MKFSGAKKTIVATQTFDRSDSFLISVGALSTNDRGPKATTERHGRDLVVPVRVWHAGDAEAGEVVAAAARRRSHATLLEVLLVPVVAAFVTRYSLILPIILWSC